MRRSGADGDAQIQDVVAKVTEVANQFPKLRALGESWAEADVDLDYGLNTILDGLAAQLG
ncbi:hypothetical protein [Micromonospora sp. CPCC 206061]|uniref:hypothetical protein n=1 Tax=Micromonospora sp. CPCC 206061 TaxID=3122410 RepID=UPI002FF345C1